MWIDKQIDSILPPLVASNIRMIYVDKLLGHEFAE